MLDAPSTHTSAQQYVLPLSLNKQSRLIVKMTWPFQPVHECLLVTVEGVAVSDAISLVALPGSSPHKSHVVHRKLTFNWTGIKQNPSVVENNFCIFPSFEENIDGASIISRSCLLKTTHSTERRPIDMTIIPLYNGSDHRYDDCSWGEIRDERRIFYLCYCTLEHHHWWFLLPPRSYGFPLKHLEIWRGS